MGLRVGFEKTRRDSESLKSWGMVVRGVAMGSAAGAMHRGPRGPRGP